MHRSISKIKQFVYKAKRIIARLNKSPTIRDYYSEYMNLLSSMLSEIHDGADRIEQEYRADLPSMRDVADRPTPSVEGEVVQIPVEGEATSEG